MSQSVSGIFLLAAVFIVAICGLVYELVAASLSTYLLGGSITQFSIVIGVFLTAMGIGSYLTRYIEKHLTDAFIAVQIGVALVGGCSAAILLFSFSVLDSYLPILLGVIGITGTFVGMEIPLLIRILQSQDALRITVSNVLALDYLGALFASVAFPLVFVPYVGLLRTSFGFGLINILVALTGLRVLRPMLRKRTVLLSACILTMVILGVGLAGAGLLSDLAETILYRDEIVLTRQTKYQRLVVTKWHGDLRLFIDGSIQFSTVDEHRYHESLVHPVMSAVPGAKRALILGGGDGMTAREILKYPEIETIDLVDLDAEMIRLFRDRPFLAALSGNALSDPRVSVHVTDAGKYLEISKETWDVIFIDLPDPKSVSLARLYTTSFYRLVATHLSRHGALVTQATSPFYAPQAFWCIVETLRAAPIGPEGNNRFRVYPYHVYVPSFGDWGFVMACRRPVRPNDLRLKDGLRLKFLTNALLEGLFVFPKDVRPDGTYAPNRIDDQSLVRYYRQGWRRFGP